MNTSLMPYKEQRGTLTYQKLDYTYETKEGWFHLSHNHVVMRNIRGRKWFRLCLAELVHDFTPADQ